MNIIEHVCAGVAIFVFVFTFVFVDSLMPYTSYSLRHLITNMMPQSCYPPLCKFFIRMTITTGILLSLMHGSPTNKCGSSIQAGNHTSADKPDLGKVVEAEMVSDLPI